jgi:hypothetical protein
MFEVLVLSSGQGNLPTINKVRNRLLSNLGTLFPDDLKPQVFLLFFALVIQLAASAISGVGFSLNTSGFWLSGFNLWILWFIIMFFIVNPNANNILTNHRKSIKRGAMVIIILLALLGLTELVMAVWVAPKENNPTNDFAQLLSQMEHGFQYNDGTALQQQAIENLLRGRNPYSHSDIIAALLKYHGSFDRVTPLRDGSLSDVFPYPPETQLKAIWDRAIHHPSDPPIELESRVCYPAGFFLLPAPFVSAGIKDIRIVYLIFVLIGLAFITFRIPPKKRLPFIIFAAVSLELWNSLANGETGSIIFPLLLIAWVSLDNNQLLSAFAMGLAVATKQTAWFFLPFYLILLWHKSGLRPFAFVTSIIIGTFILINVYFFILAPSVWLASVTSPMTDHLFPLGIGIVSLVTGGILNIRSSLPFTVIEAVALIGCATWYGFNAKRFPLTGPVLAVFPLFFAWRSLWSYFFYVQIIVLACILTAKENSSSLIGHPMKSDQTKFVSGPNKDEQVLSS